MEISTGRLIPVIVITGPVGAGKTTVMGAISELLDGRGIRHAAIDQDALRMVHPYPDDEPFGATVGYRNLAAIWSNLVGYGVRCVVIADVVEDRTSSQAAYTAAMPGTTITVVRLDVDLALIRERLARRDSGEGLAWSLDRAPELQAIMERNGIGDLVIDVGERTPGEIADEIVRKLDLS